ncbi:very short patch repair endonuclease [Luminiphilus syltensis]|uniref:very short patch repair endonuclease n=1 Tax=Luminiphilus syltensis TaxID=1341119 RepID=UPI0009D73208|nr:very short patch repair endonuclease [Luminiphilus syltensis]
MDRISKKARSKNMAAIRGKNTRPELQARAYLHAKGVRFRTHVKDLPGKPDVAIKKYFLVLEVRGCFWHGHEGCEVFRLPKSNRAFWSEKINGNKARDLRNVSELEKKGYLVFVAWGCDLAKGNYQVLDSFIAAYHDRKNSFA